MIIVVATIDFADQASRDAAVEASKPVQWATRADEPGCHAYCFGADPCVDTRVQVYELWEDEASLAAHFQHPNYHEMRRVLRDKGIVATANRMYLTVRDEPVYAANGKTRERFFVDQE
jgi:quinol monooxygenase YgiN